MDVGEGSVVDGVITFPVDGTAKQVQPLDAAALERMVLGLPKAEAEAALAPYGDVVIVLWPGYVTNVPTMDARVTRRDQRRGRRGTRRGDPRPVADADRRAERVAARDWLRIAVRDLVPARGVALGHGSERAGTIRLMFRTPAVPFNRAPRTLRRTGRRAA